MPTTLRILSCSSSARRRSRRRCWRTWPPRGYRWSGGPSWCRTAATRPASSARSGIPRGGPRWCEHATWWAATAPTAPSDARRAWPSRAATTGDRCCWPTLTSTPTFPARRRTCSSAPEASSSSSRSVSRRRHPGHRRAGQRGAGPGPQRGLDDPGPVAASAGGNLPVRPRVPRRRCRPRPQPGGCPGMNSGIQDAVNLG
jgi:hypothetical protein